MSTVSQPLLSPELLAKLESLELVSRKIFRGRMKGERRSTRKGQSVEFADFRPYVHGDDLRFIDWNSYARLDRLFLKLFLEEEDLHFYALIDASASMEFGDPTKLHYAKQLAAALAFIGLARADRVKIETLQQEPRRPGPMFRGRQSLWRMLAHLEQIEPASETRLVEGIKNFCLRNSGKGIVVVISDLMDKRGYEEALRYLVAQRMDVYVVHVLSAEEIDPDVKGDLRLIDCEDGDVAEITVSDPLLKRYKQSLAAFTGGAKEFCSRRGMSYLLADTRLSVDQLVSNYLRKRGLVRVMWPQWSNMLGPWQWAAIGLVPPALVALYFLKLKRQPLLVPSTFLWRRSIEDMHVNSLWQKLRNSLLLLLQLLMVALVMLALGRPGWEGSQLAGGRQVFLIDNSASMAAADVAPSRLEEAKRRALELVDQMKSDDVAMVVSFSDGAQVAQSFTHNRQELRRGIESIRPTDRSTSIAEALRAASGLANPNRTATDERDVPTADPLPAKLFVFSDGKFPDVKDFSLGNLEPIFVSIGSAEASNVAITALGVGRREDQPDARQLFARIENFAAADAKVEVTLHHGEELLDADTIDIAAGGGSGVAFDLNETHDGVLELRLQPQSVDHLALDNRGFVALGEPRKSRVLLVTSGNEPLKLALATQRARELTDLSIEPPEYLASDEYKGIAAGGLVELIVYDRCAPADLPQTNTLFIGRLPPGKAWSAKEPAVAPQIIDTDAAHPLMQLVDMGDVLIAEGTPLVPPTPNTVLIDTSAGPMFAIAARDGWQDAVLGMELIGADSVGTNWPVRLSFPVFALNVLEYFGRGGETVGGQNVRPGGLVTLHLDTPAERLAIVGPDRVSHDVPRGKGRAFYFSGTSRVGVYEIAAESQPAGRFTVNLLDAAESDIRPRAEGEIQIGYVKVKEQVAWEPSRIEGWRWLVLATLGVLIAEWYMYNRRLAR